MSLLITICARGGSKGILEKNIKFLNGKPLIYYTIQLAKEFENKFRDVEIVLSTDSEDIMKVAEDNGLKAEYRRPDYLAGDDVGKIDAIREVLYWKEEKNKCKFDYILDLDVSSPLRNLSDLSLAFRMIQENDSAINLFSVSPANKSPYFNMVEQKKDGFFSLSKRPQKVILARQSAPKVYELNASFYFYKRAFFEAECKGVITNKSLVYIVPHICFDLDYPIDFEIISFLMENKKLDFDL